MTTKQVLRELLKQYYLILVEYRDGNLYLLWQHHRYSDPVRDARRVLVARDVKKPELFPKYENIYYVHHPDQLRPNGFIISAD